MKPTRIEREKLARALRQRQAKSELSQSHLAELAKVDPSQTSRILGGHFMTLSGNVLRICNALGVDPQAAMQPEPSARQARMRAAWTKLEASVRRAWDQTPQGADRLVAVIDAVAQVRSRRGAGTADMDETGGEGAAG